MRKLLEYVVLPKEITSFEASYLRKVNRIALGFFALHVPVLIALAWLNGTRPGLALALSLGVLVGPAVATSILKNPRIVSLIHGVTAMFFGGLLVHFGQGPVQIEMHFYFFALIAMLVIFGNPLVIVGAASTVALHHLLLWFLLPRSVFNYDAPIWVVAVHAGFVVLESAAGIYIARTFFDRVIGLEKIVHARTDALDSRTRDMRLVLDHVDQGLATIDRLGMLSPERSEAWNRWFGEEALMLFDALGSRSIDFAAQLALAWDQLVEEVLPMEVLLAQLPRTFSSDGSFFEVAILPIGTTDPLERCLVVVTDVTSRVVRERAEQERRELFELFERFLADPDGVRDFFTEARSLVESIVGTKQDDVLATKRRIHTLKGTSSLFGLEVLAAVCHELEDHLADGASILSHAQLTSLTAHWGRVAGALEQMIAARPNLGDRTREGSPPSSRARFLESTKTTFDRIARQAGDLATRLKKDVDVVVEDNGVSVDSRQWAGFWPAFVHGIRNALDHGLESRDERLARGKSVRGRLTLRSSRMPDGLCVEIADDGRGIDWDLVRRRAEDAGLATDTREALEAALFADGFSTASEITDISGRGIGLAALREATKRMGGELHVDSSLGRGTTMRMVFTTEASASPVSLRALAAG